MSWLGKGAGEWPGMLRWEVGRRLPSGPITVGTGRRVGGWMGVMAMPQLPNSLLLW